MASPDKDMDDDGNLDDDLMKILIATDNHIGYMEKDPVRFNDSLEAFEEILKIAKSQNVDFILLGGDMYHENKPSRQTLHRSMELLRYYCMGDRPCPIEFRSDPSYNFHHSKFPVVNYEDPNYNVSIPVFTIHGNHDDPVGEGTLSAMDILQVSNLINYFGKIDDIEKIELSPLLLQKGDTKLALYGLGSCRDERLHRTFRKGNVKFLRPSEDKDKWLNVLVLHQNRAKHGTTNYIPPSFLPDFFDLVIWGHEHECRLEPEFVPTGTVGDDGEDLGIFISQPGSSIATSLSDGEQMSKHCGILYIKSDCTFRMEPVKLKTVRPFILDSVSLSDTGINPQDIEQVESFLTMKVNKLIEKVKAESENDKHPLVRLKVDYHGGYSTFSLARFGQKFLDKVANPKNILLWHSKRDKSQANKVRKEEGGEEDGHLNADIRALSSTGISEYLDQEVAKEKIDILSDKNMAEAIHEYVDKMENDSVETCVKYSLQVSQEHLKSMKVKEDDIEDHMDKHRVEYFEKQETEGMTAARKELKESRLARPDRALDSSSDSDSNVSGAPAAPKRGRGRGRGRGSSARGRGTLSGAAQGTTKSRGGRGGRGKKTQESPHPPASPILDLTSRKSKRSLFIDDDDSDTGTTFQSIKRPKKDYQESIDLTQDSDEDMKVQSNTSHSVKSVHKSRRTKK